MKTKKAEWFITLSATMRFGKPGGMDLLEQLENTGLQVAEPELGHMWHLMSLRKEVIERVGTFDENFYPAYYEDTDYAQRIRYAFDDIRWAKIFIDVSSMGNAHAVAFGKINMDATKNIEYYKRKWGGVPGQQRFARPFNDDTKDVSWWRRE